MQMMYLPIVLKIYCKQGVR